jgi:hypothetical protein
MITVHMGSALQVLALSVMIFDQDQSPDPPVISFLSRRQQPQERHMETGEMAYLTLVISAMVIFMLAVAYAASTSSKH